MNYIIRSLGFVTIALILLVIPVRATSVTANFTCSNSSTTLCDAEWGTELGGIGGTSFGIFANEAYGSGCSVSPCIAAWVNGATFTGDQEATLTIGSLPGSIGPCVRAQNDNLGNGYCTDLAGAIMKVVSGTPSDLVTGCTTGTTGDEFKLEVIGTTLTLYKNGVSACTVTDATYSAGFPGMYGATGSNSKTASAWSAMDLGGGPTFPSGIPNFPIPCCAIEGPR